MGMPTYVALPGMLASYFLKGPIEDVHDELICCCWSRRLKGLQVSFNVHVSGEKWQQTRAFFMRMCQDYKVLSDGATNVILVSVHVPLGGKKI